MRTVLLTLLAIAALSPLSAGAHNFGVSYVTHVDNLDIDIGYSTAAPSVGETVIFDFNLPATSTAKYSDAWIRVEDEKGNVVLATAVHNAAFGGPRMSYVFPHAGTFTINVRYENESDAVTKVAFPITVLPATGGGILGRIGRLPAPAALPLGFVAGALALAVAGFFARKRLALLVKR